MLVFFKFFKQKLMYIYRCTHWFSLYLWLDHVHTLLQSLSPSLSHTLTPIHIVYFFRSICLTYWFNTWSALPYRISIEATFFNAFKQSWCPYIKFTVHIEPYINSTVQFLRINYGDALYSVGWQLCWTRLKHKLILKYPHEIHISIYCHFH